MANRIRIETTEQAAEWMIKFHNLNEVIGAATRSKKPIGRALRRWLEEHRGEDIVAEGSPPLGLEVRGAGTAVDCKSMLEHDIELLTRLADLGLLSVDWDGAKAAMMKGLLNWPVQQGRYLYIMPLSREEMRFRGDVK